MEPFDQTDPVAAAAARADASHLRTLSICHYVMAFISLCVCGGYGAMYGLMGTTMSAAIKNAPATDPGRAPPPEVADMFEKFFVGFGVAFAGVGVFMCVLQLLAGFALAHRKWLPVCYAAAGLSCLQMPLGTVLGIFTFIVLGRRSVAAEFDAVARGESPDAMR